mgnify:CR=1 FL=1
MIFLSFPLLYRNDFFRTLFGTESAVDTFLIINMSNIIFYRNRSKLTFLRTKSAADASGFAHRHDVFSLVFRITLY